MVPGRMVLVRISVRESAVIITKQILHPTTIVAEQVSVSVALRIILIARVAMCIRTVRLSFALRSMAGLLKCFWIRKAKQRRSRNKRAMQSPAP